MTKYAGEQATALLAVTRATRDKVAAEAALVDAGHEWRAAIRVAVAAGVTSADVANAAGTSKGYVSRVAPRPKTRDGARLPRVHAQKNVSAASCVTTADTVPHLPATVDVSGVVTVRQRRKLGRQTLFVSAWAGGREPVSLAYVLDQAWHAGAERVYLTGPAPVDSNAGATNAEQCRAWCLSDPGFGWAPASSGHYLKHPELPTLRFEREGRRVTILRAASWWGETDADVATCEAAWRGLGRALDSVKAFRGAGLADTPGTTGRALWLRTIPEAGGFEVMGAELRELLHATSGQGRVQLMAPALDRMPRFTQYDGRFMYAGLLWGMPIGAPQRWTGAQLDGLDARAMERALRGRGRWRVTVTVPDDWQHVGLLMAPAAGGGWCYPDAPGQTFETWADGSELWLAMANGWNPTFHEGITWAEGRPLNAWRDALVGLWQEADDTAREQGIESAKLGAKAIRAIVLHTVGAFAARSHPTTGSTSIDTPERVPADVVPGSVHTVGDRLVYELPGRPAGWAADAAHPEWSATVWARARTRLLHASSADRAHDVGALHVPRADVVGFATDALYLANDPQWPDDGGVGRFRRKGIGVLDAPWPTSYGELYRLRDIAEAVAE